MYAKPLKACELKLRSFRRLGDLFCYPPKFMTGPIKSEPRGNEILRATSFASAGLLFLHAAAFPIYWGFGSLMILGVPEDYKNLGSILTVTATISLAAFCLSTQFYLNSQRQQQ
tara:strand:+ start:1956 stop:2297 length:342 start_codon:yes stop_codon:yes gene_type:complete